MKQRQAFKNHIEELHRIYGKVAIVSLIDKKGPEESIGDAFEQTVKVINDPDLMSVSLFFSALLFSLLSIQKLFSDHQNKTSATKRLIFMKSAKTTTMIDSESSSKR